MEAGQIWVAKGDDGLVRRKLRILAKHPKGGWVVEEMPASMKVMHHRIFTCPELNLRYVFTLEDSVANITVEPKVLEDILEVLDSARFYHQSRSAAKAAEMYLKVPVPTPLELDLNIQIEILGKLLRPND